MSRVLVTGASGFIGSHLCRRLVHEGLDVHAVSRHAQEGGAAHWWQADLTDAEQTSELLHRTKPDVIHHLAALNSGSRELDAVLPVLQHNLVATANLLVAAVRASCGLVVLAGSTEEPEPHEPTPLPVSSYAAAKHAAGAYARLLAALFGLRVVHLRVSMVYGPGQRPPKIVPSVVMPLLRGESPKLSRGAHPVDWVYIDDVVDAFVAAGKRPDLAGEIIEIGSGKLVTVRNVVEEIVDLMGTDVRPAFGAIPARPLEQVRKADVKRSRELLGWEARTNLTVGLEATIAWCSSEIAHATPGVQE